ncbi:uncharacterized protein LAESUDRAFT_731364 [Laetiporus sulphureus 93-53]|uniref:Uncharacterized protein n=1 Tax=Laetiporus sulphureus 93-53 TaxID=1314785 RepID=A0A165BLP4_9APHY|nr:uncharacterized protein LAESUDRAFT_731364 [Laetiporus sulphureus 93-53]KZT01279.1 hypothetical protein LAESUDRAFT_731364 [Laetiporus sulphureus 93-53]
MYARSDASGHTCVIRGIPPPSPPYGIAGFVFDCPLLLQRRTDDPATPSLYRTSVSRAALSDRKEDGEEMRAAYDEVVAAGIWSLPRHRCRAACIYG